MTEEEGKIRADIVEVGRRLYARGLIGGNEGNISVRRGEALFVTPAGVFMMNATDAPVRSTGSPFEPRSTIRPAGAPKRTI